jgi:hypothetical protein
MMTSKRENKKAEAKDKYYTKQFRKPICIELAIS